MSSRRTDADVPDDNPAENRAKATSKKVARGSVQEAIGTLIGDDAARKRGAAEKQAGTAEASAIQKSSRS